MGAEMESCQFEGFVQSAIPNGRLNTISKGGGGRGRRLRGGSQKKENSFGDRSGTFWKDYSGRGQSKLHREQEKPVCPKGRSASSG